MNTSIYEQLARASRENFVSETDSKESVIEIQSALRHVTAIYERVRTLIDYQEERFLRRLAIRRILFRRLIIERKNQKMGESLVKEVIRAGYLENGRYPISFGNKIDTILKKYLEVLPIIERHYPAGELIKMQRRIVGLAAAEIEDAIVSPAVEMILLDRLSQEVASYKNNQPDDLTYTVALQNLLKADTELTTWRLFTNPNSKSYEQWQNFINDPQKNVSGLMREFTKIEFNLQDSRTKTLIQKYKRLVPPYLVLADLAYQKGDKINLLIEDPTKLENVLTDLVNARIDRSEGKLRQSVVRTTIYILLTKMVIGVGVEVPLDKLLQGHVSYLPLIANITIPPLLMFLATMTLRPPGRKNTEILVGRTKAILLGKDVAPFAELEEIGYRSSVMSTLFSLLYTATYVVSFGGIIWFLNLIGFSPASIGIFIFFLCVVGFFAYRIRNNVNELAVIKERDSFGLLIFDFFALPFLRAGRWLSGTIQQINITLFIFDFLIEAPFKVVLAVVEDWFAYLREKREELN